MSENEAKARERAAVAEGQLQAMQASAAVHAQLQSQMLNMAQAHTTAQAAIFTSAQVRDTVTRQDDARRHDSSLQNLMEFAAYNTKMYTVGTAMNSAAIAGQHGAVAAMAEHATGSTAQLALPAPQLAAPAPAPDNAPPAPDGAPALALPPPPPGLEPGRLALPAATAAPTPAATAAPTTVEQKIEKLACLLGRGLISQGAHDAKLMSLLDSEL